MTSYIVVPIDLQWYHYDYLFIDGQISSVVRKTSSLPTEYKRLCYKKNSRKENAFRLVNAAEI